MNTFILFCFVAFAFNNPLCAMQDDPYQLGEDLLSAAIEGDHDKVLELLNNGVKIDYIGDDGETALMWASECGHQEILHLLIERNARLNYTRDDGMTALAIAAGHNMQEICKVLICAMLKQTKEQKKAEFAYFISLNRNLLLIKDIKRLMAECLVSAHKQQNKAMAIREVNKIENRVMEQELLRFINEK